MDALSSEIGLLFIIGLFIAFILVIRWLGAWMLRIDEVIKLLAEIRNLLRNNN